MCSDSSSPANVMMAFENASHPKNVHCLINANEDMPLMRRIFRRFLRQESLKKLAPHKMTFLEDLKAE